MNNKEEITNTVKIIIDEERRTNMGTTRCFECGNDSGNWIFKKENRVYEGDGYCFNLEVDVPYCDKCGSPIDDREIEEAIREKANAIIREQTENVTREEILRLIAYYNASQKYLSKVLGWGEVTLPRYISGNYTPNRENSEKLKSIQNPYIMLNYARENADAEVAAKRLIDSINLRILNHENEKGKLYKVVDWFLHNSSDEEGITHLALQKALYFTQAWNYIFNGEWLFPEECEAWAHGAVYREVYDDFKTFKYSKLPEVDMEINFDDKEKVVLEFVKKNYIDVYSAKALERICHLEEPFINARAGLKEDDRSWRAITKKSIATYYKSISDKYKIDIDNRDNVKKYLNALLLS